MSDFYIILYINIYIYLDRKNYGRKVSLTIDLRPQNGLYTILKSKTGSPDEDLKDLQSHF